MNSATDDTTGQHTHSTTATSTSRARTLADIRTGADYFERRLRHETDCADVHLALNDNRQEEQPIVLIDARSEQDYRERHIPGAISLPHGSINADTMRGFAPTTAFVTYCWGPHCNGATKAAANIAALGLDVREMLGGMWGWEQEGYAFASGGDSSPADPTPTDRA